MNDMKNILIMLSPPFLFTKEQLDRACSVAGEYKIVTVKSEDVTEEQIKSAEIIFGWPNVDILKNAPYLKWLHLPSAGADRYTDKNIYANRNTILTTSTGTFGKPMAEHAVSLILAFYRNLHLHVRNGMAARWERFGNTRDFFGSTVGIIGLGDIGGETAKRCKALGAKVIAVKRHVSEKPEYVDELYSEQDINILLENSDAIVMALPNTVHTKGFLSSERINRMKKNAFIVNLGRGSSIDQNALINALKENKIAGAGLDVTDPEPLPKDSPLWYLPNVIITSHTSGFSPTSINRCFDIFLYNLIRYTKNQELINTVDFNEGY